MRTIPLAGLVAAALTLASCGTVSPGHDSPSAAMAGFAQAARDNDVSGLTEWLPPSDQQRARQSIASLRGNGIRLTFDVQDFEIVSDAVDPNDGNKATVTVKGELLACVQPAGQRRTCSSVTGVGAALQDEKTFTCVRENGAWYVRPAALGAPAAPPGSPRPGASPASQPTPSR